tara:strand:- start:3691 stop:4899 length:1209 start_codon:yes stop_codon:yes gene_type:complete
MHNVFMSGPPRSGSTAFCSALNVNKQTNIVVDPCVDLFRSWRNTILKNSIDLWSEDLENAPFLDYYYSDKYIKIMEYIQESDPNVPLEKSEWDRILPKILKRMQITCPELIPYFKNTYAETYRDTIQNILDIIPKARKIENLTMVGIRESWIIEMFFCLAKTFPKAKFIILLRDVRAFISSALRQEDPNRIGHILSSARGWRKILAFTVYYQKNPLFKERLLVMSYEKFIQEPEKQLNKACNFLGIEYDKRMLNTDNYIDYSTGKTWLGNSNYETVTSGISAHRIDRWRQFLPLDVCKVIELTCFPDLHLIECEPTQEIDSVFQDYEDLVFMIRNEKNTLGWRISNRAPEQEYGLEMVRRKILLSSFKEYDVDIIKRMFLFKELFDLLKQKPISSILGTDSV